MLRRLAVFLVVGLVMVLGLCPALALADEVALESEGTEEPVAAVQSEGVEVEAETDEDVALQVQSDAVTYLDSDGSVQTCTAYTLINSTTTTWSDGWYVVKGKVGITGGITYSGFVHLILADDAELTVTGSISNNDGSATNLTIYGQEGGTGKLSVTNSDGAALYCCQGITINGGIVEAKTTGNDADGIHVHKGDVIINGGTVTADGAHHGICADGGATGNVTINGGSVTAIGAHHGIHAHGNNAGYLTINGGTVEAVGTGAEGVGVCTQAAVLRVGANVTSFTASGVAGAWSGENGGTLMNYVAGLGWTDTKGTAGETTIKVGEHSVAAMSDYKNIHFPLKRTITVVSDPAEGGTATAGAAEAIEGETVTLEAVSADGYLFDSWTVSGEGAAIDTATIPTATLTMGSADVTVTAHFKKDEPVPVVIPDVTVTAHVQRIGWMAAVTDGGAAGTTGMSRRMEALTLKLPEGVSGGIEYRSHLRWSGWEQTWAHDGEQSGTTGKSLRAEAVEIRLTGEAADVYDVYYRVHVQRIGWMAWAKNGESAGTTGMSRRAEAVQVALVPKDAPAPDATYKGVTQDYDKACLQQ